MNARDEPQPTDADADDQEETVDPAMPVDIERPAEAGDPAGQPT